MAMATTAQTNQTSIDIEEYLRDLLECPVCMETIKSVPVYQCTNGHVICKVCIEKLDNCPICRNDSALVRSLKLENIVQRLEGIQPKKMGSTTATTHLQKWGKGSVKSYGTINRHVEIPIPQAGINQDQQAARLRIQREKNKVTAIFTLFGLLLILGYFSFVILNVGW